MIGDGLFMVVARFQTLAGGDRVREKRDGDVVAC